MAETAAEAAFGGVDKNRDGLIDAEELAEAFEAMDEDGSGTIDIEELGAAMRRLGAPITVEEVAELMAQVDVDGNGFLDVEEFRKAAEAFINAGPGGALPQQADSRGPAQIIFEQIDTDGSGYIDIDELSFALRRMGRAVPATELREVMDSVDLNGDGQLDLEEFTKAGEAFLQRTVNAVDSHIGGQTDSARAIFDKIDVDGSGTIDAQELGFALERMGRQVTQEELITMMQSVDVDGDGQLTFEEFEAMSGEFVARAVYRSVNKKALVRGTLELNSKAVGELDIGEYIEARCKAQALADANESGAVPQPQNDEVPPGTQIHVRGIGVDGWDSTPEGKGSHESESALKAIFEQYGKFLQATIRHRIEGPSGKWDPKTTPAADWPREGSKNSSWALVTMETTSAVDAALEASELEGVYAGAQLLKLTRFSKDVASTSGGAMAAVRELDQNEKKRRATRIQFEAVWSEHGANLGLSGWVSMTASSGEMLLERVPAAEAEVWKSRQKQKLLEHAIAIFRNLSERSDMCTVYKALYVDFLSLNVCFQTPLVGCLPQ
jgi:calcium-binding protein CML